MDKHKGFYDGSWITGDMMLMDFFAGQALIGLHLPVVGFREKAVLCYDMAEAMLKERQRRIEAQDERR